MPGEKIPNTKITDKNTQKTSTEIISEEIKPES